MKAVHVHALLTVALALAFLTVFACTPPEVTFSPALKPLGVLMAACGTALVLRKDLR